MQRDPSEPHGGYDHCRERWDWASRDNHARWITGSSSTDHYERSGWQDAMRLIRLCPSYRDLTVLEWGCGSGRVTQYLCRLFRKVHAVDISPGMLDLVRARELPDVVIHETSGADLDTEISVDVVYSYLCWMHNRKDDLEPIIRACRRALNPGGRLLFQLPVYDVPREPQSYIDLACWTPRELGDLATRTGFEIRHLAASPGAFSMDAIGRCHFDLHDWSLRADAEPRQAASTVSVRKPRRPSRDSS